MIITKIKHSHMRKTITTLILLAAITTAAAQTTIFGIQFRSYKNLEELISTYRNNAKEFSVKEVPINTKTAHCVSATDFTINGLDFDLMVFGLTPELENKGRLIISVKAVTCFSDPMEALAFIEKIHKMAMEEKLIIEKIKDKPEGDKILETQYIADSSFRVYLQMSAAELNGKILTNVRMEIEAIT